MARCSFSDEPASGIARYHSCIPDKVYASHPSDLIPPEDAEYTSGGETDEDENGEPAPNITPDQVRQTSSYAQI